MVSGDIVQMTEVRRQMVENREQNFRIVHLSSDLCHLSSEI